MVDADNISSLIQYFGLSPMDTVELNRLLLFFLFLNFCSCYVYLVYPFIFTSERFLFLLYMMIRFLLGDFDM